MQLGVLGVDVEALLDCGKRGIEVIQLDLCCGEAVESLEEGGVELDTLLSVRHGSLPVLLGGVRGAPVGIIDVVIAVELDGIGVLLDCFVVFLRRKVRVPLPASKVIGKEILFGAGGRGSVRSQNRKISSRHCPTPVRTTTHCFFSSAAATVMVCDRKWSLLVEQNTCA